MATKLHIPKTIRRPEKSEKTPTKRATGQPADLKNKSKQSRGVRVFDPDKHCGAQLRKKARGRLCTQFKGAKTPHPGEGRCWLHGGLTPIKHGLSSLIQHGRMKDMLRKMCEIDHDVLDLTPEIELLRALTYDFVNRYDTFMDVLETWYNALDAQRAADELPPVPRKFPSIEDAGSLLEAISRMVERIHKVTRDGSISLDTFRGMMEQMGMVVASNVSDKTVLDAIEKGWASVMVSPKSFVKDPGLPVDDEA